MIWQCGLFGSFEIPASLISRAKASFRWRKASAVSVGHQSTIHGALVEDGALIGIGARVLDGARIGAGALIAAGAVVREGMRVPPHSLVVGVPGVIKRELNEREREVVARTPERYLELARRARLSLAGPEPTPVTPLS